VIAVPLSFKLPFEGKLNIFKLLSDNPFGSKKLLEKFVSAKVSVTSSVPDLVNEVTVGVQLLTMTGLPSAEYVPLETFFAHK
jgi:hypothetical protein